MTTRQRFVARFGETDARTIEEAARQHRTEKNPLKDFGEILAGAQITTADDQFLLDIATCISWECLTRFYTAHGFTSPQEEVREWITNNANPPGEYRDPCCRSGYSEYLGEM